MKKALTLSLILASAACGAPDDNHVVTSQDELSTYNGTTYNGISFGGLSLYATKADSTDLSGLYKISSTTDLTTTTLDTVSGVGPNGESYTGGFEDLTIDGSGFEGALKGSDLVGHVFKACMENGAEVGLWVRSVAAGEGTNADLLYYRVEISKGEDQWQPLCGLDAEGNAKLAIAVPGGWNTAVGEDGGDWKADEGQFSFACVESSIAKCVEMGYRQDITSILDRPHMLLACVRMMRADFCGDGQTHTQDGTLIEVWDRSQINDQENADWTIEAGWTPDGAVCLQSARHDLPDCGRTIEADCSKWYVPWYVKTSFPHDGTAVTAEEPAAQETSTATEQTTQESTNKWKKSWR